MNDCLRPNFKQICPKQFDPSATCDLCVAWDKKEFVEYLLFGGWVVDALQRSPSLVRWVARNLKKHFEHVARAIKPKEAAAIHATVLSILVGVFSAYSIYAYGEIRRKQQDAMSKAEEINRVEFIRSAYKPQGKDVLMAAGPEDIERLRASLIELTILSLQNPGITEVANVKIPEDPTERAERILGIMNVVSHRYPFPKAIEGTSGNFAQFRPEPIMFTDIETLRQWLKDLDHVLNNLHTLTVFMPLFFPNRINPYLDALALKEKENIEKAKADPKLRPMGEKDPYRIVDNFIKGMFVVDEIYRSTLTALKRADNYQASLMSKTFILLILGSGFLIFMIGVVLPLLSIRLNSLFYIHLPLVYYTFVFIMMMVKISRI